MQIIYPGCFFCMCAVVCIFFVAMIGLNIVRVAIIALLWTDGNYYAGSLECFALALGLVFWPGCIWALQSRGSSQTQPIREVLIFLMAGFSICATCIIYFYGLKMIIIGSVPSNEVYSVMANLFAFSLPIWLICSKTKEQRTWSRICSYLPCTYAPLILLQIYSIGVRIVQYGLTPKRYAGVMLILFEIIAIVICSFKRKYCDKLLLVGAVMVFVAVFLPFVNMHRLSDISQKGREIVIVKEESEQHHQKYDSIHGCQLVGEINIEGYAAMNMLNQSEKYDMDEEEGGIEPDFTAFQFYKRETGEEITIDISEFAQKCFAYKQEHPDSNKEEESTYLKQFNRIEIDDNMVFYVNHFEVTYYTMGESYEAMEIKRINISGMLLEK